MNQWLEIVKTTYFRQSFLLLLQVLSMAVQDNPEKERATVSLYMFKTNTYKTQKEKSLCSLSHTENHKAIKQKLVDSIYNFKKKTKNPN